jgi:hypothetical protein
MEFLLLLSAFLSALTGAISGVRAPEMQIHHASAQTPVAAIDIQAPRRAVGARVSQSVATLASAAWPASEPVAWFVAASIPLYADRLRE